MDAEALSATERARAALVQAVTDIAPDADPSTLRGDDELRLVLDLDSMDFLRIVARLEELLHCAIAETDYARLATLDSATAYLAGRIGKPQ